MINEEANQPIPIDVSDADRSPRSLEGQQQDANEVPEPNEEKQELTYEMEEEKQIAHEQNITAYIPGGGTIADI